MASKLPTVELQITGMTVQRLLIHLKDAGVLSFVGDEDEVGNVQTIRIYPPRNVAADRRGYWADSRIGRIKSFGDRAEVKLIPH